MKKYDDEFESVNKEPADYRFIVPILIVAVLLAGIIGFLVYSGRREKKDNGAKQTGSAVETTEKGWADEEEAGTETVDGEDPQDVVETTDGTSVDVAEILKASDAAELDETTLGIDVARYQGTIDWSQVAASGVQFAMIRAGYRTLKTGEITADSNAKYNMQEAQANGIQVGVYFFSTAVTEEEAIEEADWTADYISQYQITYPVAFNCEGFDNAESRQYGLTNTERTDLAIAFMKEIYNRGYTPMFYAPKNELEAESKWETGRIENSFKVWVAQYLMAPYPQTEKPEYTGNYAMWQCTDQGTVAGISGPVDVNVAYFGYADTADAKNGEAPEHVDADAEALMKFHEVNETVTAKQSTNLRSIPSQGTDSQVVATLQNGETVTRTGTSDSGWSRVSYNGQTLYAVSSYLTTDLSYTAPQQTTQTGAEGSGSGDGLKTKFTDCNDQVTAKIEVNLRALPSVTNPDATVVATLKNGEVVTRTGINTDYGWSRVEYNGQTLYCISSYLTGAQ